MNISKNSHGHLGYCTNIHPGELWDELFPLLQQHVPQVKQLASPDAPFGLGLRASMASITELQKPERLAQFKQWLADEQCYVFTVNGFPYGKFHGTQVKADVYRPDWSTSERLNYTCAIADVLAELSPPDDFGSISSVPGTFRDWVSPQTKAAIVQNLMQCVAHLIQLKQSTGVTIAVALEPEPACMLETVDDVIEFFNKEIFSADTTQTLASLSNITTDEAKKAIHEHLGVCYDICHAAVEFEDPLEGVQQMQAAGIPIIKLQLSSALKLPEVNASTIDSLRSFDEPVYLHQVVEQKSDKLTRYNDLPIAISAHENDSLSDAEKKEWRVHFHVPVFLSTLDVFGTTQLELSRLLEAHAKKPIAPHLEVETYTWDVLPERYRNVPVGAAIARELDWVMGCLTKTEKA